MSEYGQLICSFLTLTTHDRDLHQASATWLRKKRTHFGINEVAMKPRLDFVLAFFPFFSCRCSESRSRLGELRTLDNGNGSIIYMCIIDITSLHS